MEPTGIERHRTKPVRVERAGASESIEVHADAYSPESSTRKITQTVPGGNGADGSRATWTKPVRVSERERANQSKRTLAHVSIGSQTRKITQTVPGGNRTHI